MSPYFERLRAEGRQQGASALLAHLLQRKFGDLPEDVLRCVEQADPETLLEWSDRMITADRIDDVLH